MTWLQRWRRPDPEALAAGLTAEWAGRSWRYHDPILRAHLSDRHAVWGPVTYWAAGQRDEAMVS
jgi:hypothetical protein